MTDYEAGEEFYEFSQSVARLLAEEELQENVEATVLDSEGFIIE